jgi:hypothetical protein
MRNLLMGVVPIAIVLVLSGQAAAAAKPSPCAHPRRTLFTYHWPIKPFDREHPIRAAFGDPRTVNLDQAFGWTGPYEAAPHSFHNGVDIVAPAGTAVYSVVSGRVAHVKPDVITVDTYDGRAFQYYHLSKARAVHPGKSVVAQHTVLGWIRVRYGHLHLAEIDQRVVHNPLDPGHLKPYGDQTTPVATDLYVDDGPQPSPLNGRSLGPYDHLAVEAADPPAMALPDPWLGLPQTPALVEWRVFHQGAHGPWKIAADFRKTQPPPKDFWNVYGPGTYQNAPVFDHRLYQGTPGRYLFRVNLHPNRLRPGLYHLQVRVADVCQNHSTNTWPLQIG